MDNPIPHQFGHLLDLALAINKANREFHRSGLEDMEKWRWARDYCCVRLEVGARTGKTTLIGQRAVEGDLIVTGTVEIAEHFRKGTKAQVCSYQQLRRANSWPRFNTIWFEEAQWNLTTDVRNSLIIKLCHDADQTFIELG